MHFFPEEILNIGFILKNSLEFTLFVLVLKLQVKKYFQNHYFRMENRVLNIAECREF